MESIHTRRVEIVLPGIQWYRLYQDAGAVCNFREFFTKTKEPLGSGSFVLSYSVFIQLSPRLLPSFLRLRRSDSGLRLLQPVPVPFLPHEP